MNGYYVDNERTPLSEDVSLLASHLWHITFPSEAERIVGVVSKAPNGIFICNGKPPIIMDPLGTQPFIEVVYI